MPRKSMFWNHGRPFCAILLMSVSRLVFVWVVVDTVVEAVQKQL